MSTNDQAVRMIVARVLREILAAADEADRAVARETWTVGDRLGATLGGTVAGHAQLRKGTTRAVVSDAEAFQAWVEQVHPGEIEFISSVRVRPAYQASVLAAAKKLGDAVAAGGEEIPGITVVEGDPTVAVTLADGAVDLVAAAWQSGELWELIGDLLPALEPAPGAELSGDEG